MTDFPRKQSPEKPIDVLLVEDNPGDVRLTREAFETVETETALHVITDGYDALDFFAGRDATDSMAHPDIVLLDLNLPGPDGYEILEAIRDDPRFPYLPVIVLTSSIASEDIKRCYGASANAYLTKPTGSEGFAPLAEAVEQFWFKQAQLPPVPS